jgi:hypothetical protein
MVDKLSYANRLRAIAEEIEREVALPIDEQSTEKLTLRLKELEELKIEQAKEIEEIIKELKKRAKERGEKIVEVDETEPNTPGDGSVYNSVQI